VIDKLFDKEHNLYLHIYINFPYKSTKMKKLNLKQKLLHKSIYFRKPNNLWLANIQFGWLKINSTAIPCFEASATSPKSIRRWGWWYSFTSVLNSEFLLLLKLIFPKSPWIPGGRNTSVHHKHGPRLIPNHILLRATFLWPNSRY